MEAVINYTDRGLHEEAAKAALGLNLDGRTRIQIQQLEEGGRHLSKAQVMEVAQTIYKMYDALVRCEGLPAPCGLAGFLLEEEQLTCICEPKAELVALVSRAAGDDPMEEPMADTFAFWRMAHDIAVLAMCLEREAVEDPQSVMPVIDLHYSRHWDQPIEGPLSEVLISLLFQRPVAFVRRVCSTGQVECAKELVKLIKRENTPQTIAAAALLDAEIEAK